MCVTCENFRRDLAAWGVTCLDFWGRHYFSGSRRVVDVSFSAGPFLMEANIHHLVDCLRRNRYSCRGLRARTHDDEHYIHIDRLVDTRPANFEISEVRNICV